MLVDSGATGHRIAGDPFGSSLEEDADWADPYDAEEIIETEDGPVLRIKKEELSTYVNSAALHAIARPADYGTGAFFEGEFNCDQRASSSTFDTQISGQGTSYLTIRPPSTN